MLRFLQSAVLAVWIVLNTVFLLQCRGPRPADPRPYLLLNLLLSVETAAVTPLLFAPPVVDTQILERLAAIQATLGSPPEEPEEPEEGEEDDPDGEPE